VAVYWDTLHAAGIDAARLASYDRKITHEPDFSSVRAASLRSDLEAYLVTLTAVHGGHDLQAAALGVIGYQQVPNLLPLLECAFLGGGNVRLLGGSRQGRCACVTSRTTSV
jgi:hypothetical protein